MEVTNTLGRRKSAVARVYMSKGKGNITVNDKDYKVYFPTATLQYVVNQPFALTNNVGEYDITANIDGGGVSDKLKLCV